jgi:proline iminopeptidase
MDDAQGAAAQQPSRHALHKFSSGGKMWFHILRGRQGLAIDNVILRLTGYSLMTWQFTTSAGVPYKDTLLLTTIGAKTGKRRTNGLPYFEVDGEYLVIGSNGGGALNPGWSANVRANPEVLLRIKRKKVPAIGRVTTGEERARLYERISAINPSLPRYQESASKFGREVPLVVFRPVKK